MSATRKAKAAFASLCNRIHAVIAAAPEPINATEIGTALGIPSRAVSNAVAELLRAGRIEYTIRLRQRRSHPVRYYMPAAPETRGRVTLAPRPVRVVRRLPCGGTISHSAPTKDEAERFLDAMGGGL